MNTVSNMLHPPAILELERRPLSSEEVLTILNDGWRQLNGVDPTDDAHLPLTRESTINDLAVALRRTERMHGYWGACALFFQDRFGIKLYREDWQALLDPTARRTLGPVCDAIAELATAPAIPREMDGRSISWREGAFHAIVAILALRDRSAQTIAPQTNLRGFVTRHVDVFREEISMLSPGRMPAIRKRNHIVRLIWVGVGIWLLAAGLSQLMPFNRFSQLLADIAGKGLVFVLIAIGIALFFPWITFPRHVIPDVKTFDELAQALTSPPPRCAGDDQTVSPLRGSEPQS